MANGSSLEEVAVTKEKVGRIVWHDLFTPDVAASRSFYESVAGWSYIVEHATDFAWGGGHKDIVLAALDGEAGAGFVYQNQVLFEGWIPYVEVEDVDQAAKLAANLKGSVVKPPFEVPGVGRNCLLRDPLGAFFGVSVSRHDYPVPARQFTHEHYLSRSGAFPDNFYHQMFGWNLSPARNVPASQRQISLKDEVLAICAAEPAVPNNNVAWVPGVRADFLENALNKINSGPGSVLARYQNTKNTIEKGLVCDAAGALCCVVQI
ncbi:VOC family protein [Ruegeria sp. R13_0]|uniref:VOC family protein n=1 Tax=Ruegeria sp. R13_0 TaxID=2821099 RepID=UPI001AD9EFD8|nr:VOC family protein [Ruegeria sp. R13_0]MBO9436653.1 VOC family protein [Ruegeria sp. R13_0]